MKIGGINSRNIISSYNNNQGRVIDKVQKSNSTDRIEISEVGKSLKNYYSDNTNVNRSSNIEDIRNRINNGIYNVDAKLTAQSILDYIGGNKI